MLGRFSMAYRLTPKAAIRNITGRDVCEYSQMQYNPTVEPTNWNDKLTEGLSRNHNAKPRYFDEGDTADLRDFRHPTDQWTPSMIIRP